MDIKQRNGKDMHFSPRTYTRKCEWDNVTLPYYPPPLQVEIVDETAQKLGRPHRDLTRRIPKLRPSNNIITPNGSCAMYENVHFQKNLLKPTAVTSSGLLAYSLSCKGVSKEHKGSSMFIHASMLYYLIPGDSTARVVCPVSTSVCLANTTGFYSPSCAFCYPSLIPGVQYYEEFHLNPLVLEERGYGDDVRYTPHSSAMYLTTPSFSVAQLSSAIVNGGGYSLKTKCEKRRLSLPKVSAEEQEILVKSLYGHNNEITVCCRPAVVMSIDSDAIDDGSTSSLGRADEGQDCDPSHPCDGSPSLNPNPTVQTLQTEHLRKRLSLFRILSSAARREIYASYKDELCGKREGQTQRKKYSKNRSSAFRRISDTTAVPSQHCYYNRQLLTGRQRYGLGGAGGSVVRDVCTQVCWNDLPIPPVQHLVHFLQKPTHSSKEA